LAAVSAPFLADRKTGLVVLFAIIAIFSPAARAGSAVVAGAPGWSPPQPPSQPAISITLTAVVTLRFISASREPRFRLLRANRVGAAGGANRAKSAA
jgi:hypothetical protein